MNRFRRRLEWESPEARSALRRDWSRLLGVVIGILILGGSGAQAQLVSVGVAKTAIGVLIVIRTDGRSERLEGSGAMPLYEGDKLETRAGSKALIEFHDGTRCALNERTTLVIRSRWERDTGITRILTVNIGEIWVKTVKLLRFEVETPVANAAVRETEFNLKVYLDGRTVLAVVEGVVEFGTAFGTCPIPAGTTSVGERGKKCTRPAPAEVKSAIGWVEEVVK